MKKKPFYKKAWFWILVIVIVAVGGSAGANNGSSNTEKTAAEADSKSEEIVYTPYMASQLINDLSANALKAESTYKDQYIELTGRLGTIDSSGDYIALRPEDDAFSMNSITCYIKTEEQKEAIMELAVGDTITVKGKVKRVGEVLGYSLDIDAISATSNNEAQAAAADSKNDAADIPENSPDGENVLEEENEEAPQEKTPEAEMVYTAYTVSQMMDDLDANALKAESIYSDQYIEATGRLSVIDSSGSYISLHPEDDEWAIIGIICYVKSEEQKEKIMELTVGDTITVKGKVTSVGEVTGYCLDIDSINE